MENTDSNFHHASSPGWQLLGELELTVDTDIDHAVGKWLEMILNSLDLRPEFLNKVMNSAQEAAMRAMQAEAIQFKHVHLLVFTPPDHTFNRDNWGFFRIEKVENASDQDDYNRAIEFYLYVEG